MRNKILFYLNGKRHEVGAHEASMMLGDYLRYDRHLTGTKIVCAEGDCGACSVLKYFPHVPGVDNQHYLPINSCITLVANLDGASLVTVEALKENDRLHETQKAMIQCHGSQCGFCTPGFVVALTGLVEEKLARKECTISEKEAKNCMTGNLCRCTGYQPIIDAALTIDLKQEKSIKERYYSTAQDDDLKKAFQESVKVESDEFSYFAPKTLKEALEYLKTQQGTRIVGSTTDLGVVHNKRKTKLDKILSLHLITELYQAHVKNNVVHIGARVTLSEFRHLLKTQMHEFAEYLDVFASPQIKNSATIIGNVATASPIGDTPPVFLALGATVHIATATGTKDIPIHEFFLAYRKINLKSDEIITGISFPLPEKGADFKFFKYSNRKDLDISAVNFAMKVDWTDQTKTKIKDVTIAAGGVAATPIRFKKTENFLKQHGVKLDHAIDELHKEFTPISDLRASSAYRHILVENYFRRFFAESGGVQ